MRNMSFAMTTQQARDRTKDVTRRQGWWFLRGGEMVQQVEKGMGLKKGEKVVKIHVIRIVSARSEPIGAITQQDVIREGFPNWTPEQFIRFYCNAHRLTAEDACNRIEFEYLDNADRARCAAAAWCCSECGERFGTCRGGVETWHNGKCDVCLAETSVCSVRHYGWLRRANNGKD